MQVTTGWLIELATPKGAIWFTVNGNFTNDPNESLRFARQQDAEAAIRLLGLGKLDGLTVTEHIFYVCVITNLKEAPEQAAKEPGHGD